MGFSIEKEEAAGLDHWRPDELQQLPHEAFEQLADFCRRCEIAGKWPEALRGFTVALIHKPKATHEGALRPIGLLPYIYRIWMAVRKRKLKTWVLSLHSGGIQSATAQAWRLGATQESERARGLFTLAAFLDCSKCYERVPLQEAAQQALRSGCPHGAVALAFNMYAAPRYIRVHGAVAPGFAASSGLVPGCGFAVHFFFIEGFPPGSPFGRRRGQYKRLC